VIAKVKADLQKKKDKEKQVEKVLKEQIEIKRYKIKELNSRCDEAIDKVKDHQRRLEARSKQHYRSDLEDAEGRISALAIKRKSEALAAYKRD